MFVNSGPQGNIDTGDIGHSLRFRGAQNLSRTPGSAGNRKTWTWSGWVKLGKVSTATNSALFSSGTSGAVNTYISFYIDEFYVEHSTVQAFASNAVFRDATGFVHVVCAVNTTLADAADRVIVYINGVRLSQRAGSIAQNTDTYINSTSAHGLGYFAPTSSGYLDGYLSRICFVDGQALTPSSFGYLNTEINEWVSKSQSAVKAVVDAGGTNSFMLDFDDPNFATYNVGKDFSSKGNHWTPNNFSLTAGTTYDHMLDVPGNSFATLNPLTNNTSYGTLSNGNLSFIGASGASDQGCYTPIGMQTGKFYAEFTCMAGVSTYPITGIRDVASITVSGPCVPGGNSVTGSTGYTCAGNKYINGSSSAYGASLASGDVLGVAADCDNGAIYFSKNGVWQGSGDPTSGAARTNAANTWTGGGNTFAFGIDAFGNVANNGQHANFGQRPFTYAPPTGFKALCQRNMPDPAILNPELHFDVLLHTATGSGTLNVTGTQFSPDLVWAKARNDNYNHVLVDRIRGVNNLLSSNLTSAESTNDTVSAFLSNGFTAAGTDNDNFSLNAGTRTYVDWLWKAGGAAVTNNAGSISSQVSANVDAGFSIVTYTGTGANATVGHGLGASVKFLVIKDRTNAPNDWCVYHTTTGAGNYLLLDTTTQALASATVWNNTAPTTTVFSIGGPVGNVNISSHGYVAYCFAEIPGYSKIFSYTGNGSVDGPYVNCGFKPKYVMVKRTDAGGNWTVWDTARSTFNVIGDALFPSLPNAEAGGGANLDATAAGFKIRNTGLDYNASGATYIGIAFADVSGKFSLGR